MKRKLRRRTFVASSIAAGYFVAAGATAQQTPSAGGTLRFACIGVGGRGSANTDSAAKGGIINVLCDIDDAKLAGKAKSHPQARQYFDFRKALEENEQSIDAVVVSTPDHTHAAIALMAMRMGKHVYCEKPLCKYLEEAHQLAVVAHQARVVTQMGNQHTASPLFRAVLDAVRSGVIGHVKEVHVWTQRPTWKQGGNVQPDVGVEGPPASIHWDEFLGPAAFRPYSASYLPFNWRGWWAFGGGALGDMSCHLLNLPFQALDLRNPVSVAAQHTGHDRVTFPASSTLRWEFAATGRRPAVSLVWYDGGRRPDPSLLDGEPLTQSGCLLIGESGKLVSKEDYGLNWFRLPERRPFTPAADNSFLARPMTDQFQEFTSAIRDGNATMSNFADAGVPLTEIPLLGNLAIWAGSDSKLTWNSATRTAAGAPNLDEAIKPTYRAGYTLE